MASRNSLLLILCLACSLTSAPARAWYGPHCYSSKIRRITLTLASIAGETAGNLQVGFDDPSQTIVRLESIRAAETAKDLHKRPAHEVILARESDYDVGTFAVIITSPYSKTGFKYEFEIRDDPSECQGAIVKVSGVDAPPKISKKAAPVVSSAPALPVPVSEAPLTPEEKIPAPEPPLELPAVFPAAQPPAIPLPAPTLDSNSPETPYRDAQP